MYERKAKPTIVSVKRTLQLEDYLRQNTSALSVPSRRHGSCPDLSGPLREHVQFVAMISAFSSEVGCAALLRAIFVRHLIPTYLSRPSQILFALYE
jgi:hypothetical protein